jgi:hypothetical protein
MKIVDKYVYPKSSRANIAGLRHYTLDGTEEKLPSVTTVLGNTQPKEKQESHSTDGDNVLDFEKLKKLRETLP